MKNFKKKKAVKRNLDKKTEAWAKRLRLGRKDWDLGKDINDVGQSAREKIDNWARRDPKAWDSWKKNQLETKFAAAAAAAAVATNLTYRNPLDPMR